MYTYTFEKTSTKDLWRVVKTSTGDWTHYYFGKLNKEKLPKEDGPYLLAESFIINTGWPKGPWFEKYLRDTPGETSKRIFEEATEKGKRVHKAFEDMLKIQKGNSRSFKKFGLVWNEKIQQQVMLEEKDWGCIQSFRDFWVDHEPILLTSEFSLYNLQVGYAGTSDALLILTKECGKSWGGNSCHCKNNTWKVILLDFKATTAIRDEHGLQVAAFADAENLVDYLKGYSLNLTGDLRVGTGVAGKGYQLKIYNKTKTVENYKRFLLAKHMTDEKIKPFNPEKEIVEIESSVSITVKKRIPAGKMQTIAQKERDRKAARRKLEKMKKAKKKKSICCKADMIDGVQCIVCGADGRKNQRKVAKKVEKRKRNNRKKK